MARQEIMSVLQSSIFMIFKFRLLVKLPSILGKMKFTMMSAKNVHKYLELVESFVASQTDIFVEDSYK